MIRTILPLLAVSGLLQQANGAILFSSSGNDLTMTITSPIQFSPPSAEGGSQMFFVIEDAFSVAPASNYLTRTTSGTATVSDDQGNDHVTGQTSDSSDNIGYGNFSIGVFDPNDLLFGFVDFSNPLLINANSDVTLSAGTYTFLGGSTPVLPDFVNSTISLVNGDLDSIAPAQNVTTLVPEPSTAILASLGGLSLLCSRSRRKVA